MNKAHVIDFSPEGTAQAMHNDKLTLAFLGEQSIERATEIKFNESTQKWDIHVPTGKTVCLMMHPPETWPSIFAPVKSTSGHNFTDYEAARQVEVAWLNQCRLEGHEPESDEGLSILFGIRRNADRLAP